MTLPMEGGIRPALVACHGLSGAQGPIWGVAPHDLRAEGTGLLELRSVDGFDRLLREADLLRECSGDLNYVGKFRGISRSGKLFRLFTQFLDQKAEHLGRFGDSVCRIVGSRPVEFGNSVANELLSHVRSINDMTSMGAT